MSLQGSLAPVAANLPRGLTCKNTFLDHPSPWIDYVTVGDRPKSDPTSNATSSATLDASAAADGGGRPAQEEDAEQQSDGSSEKDGNDSPDGSRRSSKPQPIGRSQRRRMQRKAKAIHFGGAQSTHSGAEHTAEDSSDVTRSGTSTKISL
ncbi:unnamed protein product [Prorocentrum cordatum]|uniref:Uncharacterized protein n=1 Tax=Prorocentrum cordatum TaxID=2364126 RepID=A0ABN9WBB0_9DINO|nr:unnamed protein product [Polarella glacialis]